MKTMMRSILLAAAVAAVAPVALAQDKACGAADSAATEKALDRVVNWDLMYKAWQDYRHCDNALSEDLFTDALMRLAVQWKEVDKFASRYQGDKAFKAFVDKHMKSLMAKDDAKSVYSRAKSNCPPKFDGFCAEIAEVTKYAVQ